MIKQPKQGNFRIVPLGGQEEVGRNMTVFEYENDIVIVDMGIQFPEEDMPGIDYIIPNINYLKDKSKKIKAVVFTHGHLDHIGAAPILLEKLGYPLVISREFTVALIRRKMEEYKKGSTSRLKTIQLKPNLSKERINLGQLKLSFFDVEHSIMDSVGVVISSPAATVIHMGDWTLDVGLSEKKLSYDFLSKLPKPTVLMIESLGAVNKQPLVTEENMWENIRKIIDTAPGRLIIATFSTQVKRIREILNYLQKVGKKVAIDGYSMRMILEIAKKMGYIKIGRETLIDIKKINDYPPNKVVIICTGAQGEPQAVLSRIVADSHNYVKLKKSDTILFSSSIIPGNERTIQSLKDGLYRKCDNVIHNEIMDVHVSGHNNIQAIREVVRQIKPTYVLPVYANHYFLKEAKKVIKETGFPENNVFVLDNGHIINFYKENRPFIEKEKTDTSYIFVDGLGIGDVGEIVLRDRQMLAKDGMFVIVVVVDKQTGKVKGSPDIISRGFIYLRESKELLRDTRKKVIEIVHQATGSEKVANWSYIKDEIRNKIGQFFYIRTQRRPMILPVVIEV
ncbi:MAG TPA: ribonuclease J [Patescibacteria group bacterium]|nr:ribonuclease J [Patescibacteria group bacterium]